MTEPALAKASNEAGALSISGTAMLILQGKKKAAQVGSRNLVPLGDPLPESWAELRTKIGSGTYRPGNRRRIDVWQPKFWCATVIDRLSRNLSSMPLNSKGAKVTSV